MIETKPLTTQCAGPGCQEQVVQIPGHRKRLYHDDVCRQRAHRAKEQQFAGNVTIVTIAEKQALEARIAQLERENATLKALRGRRSSTDAKARHNWQDRAMAWGEKLGYQPLDFQVRVKEGVKEWRAFVREASDLVLIRLIMAAEQVDERKQS